MQLSRKKNRQVSIPWGDRRTTVRFTETEYARLEIAAAAEGVSVRDFIIIAAKRRLAW